MEYSDTTIATFRSYSMSDREFRRFSEMIEDRCGIKMPPVKKTMLMGRLSKRLRSLGLSSFGQYYDYVTSPEGQAQEHQAMIDVVTTNKTDFFREPRHFDYLVEKALPEIFGRNGIAPGKKLAVWSSACSSGEEPYTLAMVLSRSAETRQHFDFNIVATDISTRVLEKAVTAIYDQEGINPIPEPMRKKYLLRSKDKLNARFRIVPELRTKVRFERLNLLDEEYRLRDTFQIIFCRNVLIYFNRSTQEMILNRLCRHLSPGGFLFTGHSETLTGLNVPVIPVSTTIYRKRR